MLYSQLEQRLQASKQALNRAASESIVEQCKQYLALLAEYRGRLYDLQGTTAVSPTGRLPFPERRSPGSQNDSGSDRKNHARAT